MLKKDLINAVSYRAALPKTMVRAVLDAAGEVSSLALQNGQEVMLLGLGKLSLSRRGPKQARNLHTGATVLVPPRTVVVFAAASGLTKLVNGRS